MKAAVLFKQKEPLQVVELEQERPKEGEVRIQVKAAGVCASDWHVMTGDVPMRLPLVVGHEGGGVVAEVGPGDCHVSVGDHVIFSFASHCGHCFFCNTGDTVLCNGHASDVSCLPDGSTRLKYQGQPVYQMNRVGVFATEVVCSQENVIPVRKDLPWPVMALIGCSVSTGVGAVVRHARVEAGSAVLVIGCGGVGLNVIQGARLAGCRMIIAADILDNKLEMAKAFGATHVINSKATDLIKAVHDLTGLGVDYSFDALGAPPINVQAIEAVRPGGHATIIGIPGAGAKASIAMGDVVFNKKKITGAFYGGVQPDRDFPIFADLYMDKKLDLDRLISKTFSLDQINDGFAALRGGSVARGVIVF